MRGTTRLSFLSKTTLGAAAFGAAAFCAAPLCAEAQTSNLPAPPYQADAAQLGAPGAPGASSAPQSLDRYGGGVARLAPSPPSYATSTPYAGVQPATSYASATIAPRAGRYLGWAGKTQVQPITDVTVQTQGTRNTVAQQWDAPPAPKTAAEAQPKNQTYPTSGWRSYQPRPAAPQVQTWAQARPLPTSIYDSPRSSAAPQGQVQTQAYPTPAYPVPAYPGQPQAGATPIQTAQAQPYQGGPRFYSLHRDYGIQPDAIPIPPQFFGPTADLSTPPADPVLKRVTTSSGATHTEAVATDDQGGQ